ncbi:hypothetical protein Pfo_022532 [Paulownia fortunei]|nr:hypothetical protein Pfo_022532 [Paulownia fortunei]
MNHAQYIKMLCAALCLLTFLDFALGADTLSLNQTLADGDILISPGQIFELGFFSPGTSRTRFLGIWYKATPDIVVWVANRKNPIIDSQGVLTLGKNGTLVLSTAQSRIIWSSNSSRPASSPILQLLDTGNLVLADKSTTEKSYIWQSFDYPSDTRLPGMKMVQNPDTGLDTYLTSWKSADDPSTGEFIYKIENHGLSQMIILMGTQKRYRTGPWNGHYFSGIPLFHDPDFKTETVFNNGRLISISNPYSNLLTTRLTMNYSGSFQRSVMNEQRDGWSLVYALPSDLCDNYGSCGPNGICKIYETPVCECLRGFTPKSQKEWSIFDWTSGCTRIMPLDCQKQDGFLKVEGIKFPDLLNFRLNTSMGSSECHDECLKNCSCTAYSDPYIINESSGCLMWFGDLIDVRELTGEVSAEPSIYLRLPVSELVGSLFKKMLTDWNKKRKGPAKFIYITTASGFGMLVLGLSSGGILLRTRRKRLDSKKKREDLELPLFDLATIAAATNNFLGENIIGEGGFGPVYKGNLSAEQVIAVKRMSRTSGQGPEEFRNEVILISKLQHRNLVRILGCCIEGEEKMLIYEYMHNKSLDYFIFDQNRSALLTWPKRFDIIMGIARGLLYLHHDSRLKIIHRDLKTSNILLDENLNAKISDFGLARMLQGDQTTARTKRVVGTYGYMAPEYAFAGKFSIKSDVFSMGVVMLEIVSGKKNRGFKHPAYSQSLLEQAWLLWMENREMELMDACCKSSCVESQVKRCIQVGLLCVQNLAEDRPLMSTVLLMLSTEDTALPQPKKPGFFSECSSNLSQRNASGSEDPSIAVITMSEVEAR